MSLTAWTGIIDNNWNTSGNWTNGVPISGSNTYITGSNGIDNGLNQSAVDINSFSTDMGFVSSIGDIANYLQISAAVVNLGLPTASGQGIGSGRINLNLGSYSTIVNVINGNQTPLDSFLTPIRLLGAAISSLNVSSGVVGVAVVPGEFASITSLNANGGNIILGSEVEVQNITLNGGTLTNNSNIDTSPYYVTNTTLNGASIYIFNGNDNHTNVTINGSSVMNMVGTGTITSLSLSGTFDLSVGTGAVVVTNCIRYPGGKILDPNRRLSLPNGFIDEGGAQMTDNKSEFGYNRTYKIT